MRIRQYVVSMSRRGSSGPMMLPPMNELARRFGVTRMTVHKALKDLIRDKHLIVRKGIGTFINPSMTRQSNGSSQRLNVGIVVEDGKHCFYDIFYWSLIAELGREIAARHCVVNLMNLSESDPEDMAKEAKDNWVDAVIWLLPSSNGKATIKILHDSGFPTVVLHGEVEGVNCVRMDCERNAYETATELLKEGRRNIVFADYNEITQSAASQVAGIRRAFSEAEVKFNERLILKNQDNVQAALEEVLEFGIDVQAVFVSSSSSTPQVMAALQKHGVDVKTKCRILADPFFTDEIEGFAGLVREYRFAEEAKAAMDIVERCCRKHDLHVESRLFEFLNRKVGADK